MMSKVMMECTPVPGSRRTNFVLGSVLVLLSILAGCSQPQPSDLVDIREYLPKVRLDIRYATENNFTKTRLYNEPKCVLRRAVAEALVAAEAEFNEAGYTLVIYDCYRPLSVQKKMWEIVPDEKYVADPAKGSRHNRGAAVDIGLYDKYGKIVEMPTDYDDFSERAAHSNIELSADILKNRQKLRTVMEKHNFLALPSEWWHYDFLGWQVFPIMDVPLEEIP